jgi:hypothetical protein
MGSEPDTDSDALSDSVSYCENGLSYDSDYAPLSEDGSLGD